MMTVNEKYNLLSDFMIEALSPALSKYSGVAMKNTFEKIKGLMFNTWKQGTKSKVGTRETQMVKSRIDQALRKPGYMKQMAKKYGVPLPQVAKPVAKQTKQYISKPAASVYA